MARIKNSKQLTGNIAALHEGIISLTEGSETLCEGGAHLGIEPDGSIHAFIHGLNKGDATVHGYGLTVDAALRDLMTNILVPIESEGER